MTYELLQAYDAFKLPGAQLIEPREATEQEGQANDGTQFLPGGSCTISCSRMQVSRVG